MESGAGDIYWLVVVCHVQGMKLQTKATRGRRRPRAVTADVVTPGAREGHRIPAKWRKHYQRLGELLEVLERRQAQKVQEVLEQQPNFSSHMADAGTDTFDRDFALGLLSSEQDAVYEIEEAMDRIRSGDYGICEATGKPVEAGRLEAIPWTRFSAGAERQLEREGGVKRAHLGERQTVPRATPSSEDDSTE
jgi:RNA polymerase-binding transcription factor DksA